MGEYALHTVVLSNVSKELGPDIEVRVGLPNEDSWSLPFAQKQLFAEHRDERGAEGMAAAMARVILSLAEAVRMGVAGRRHALDHHTSSRYMQQLGDVLESSEAGLGVRS